MDNSISIFDSILNSSSSSNDTSLQYQYQDQDQDLDDTEIAEFSTFGRHAMNGTGSSVSMLDSKLDALSSSVYSRLGMTPPTVKRPSSTVTASASASASATFSAIDIDEN